MLSVEVLTNHDLSELVVDWLIRTGDARPPPRTIHDRVIGFFVAVHGRATLHSADCRTMMHAIARSLLITPRPLTAVPSYPEVVQTWYAGLYTLHIRSEWRKVVLTMIDVYHHCAFLQTIPYHTVRRMERHGLSPYHAHRIRQVKRKRWADTMFNAQRLRWYASWADRLQNPAFSMEGFFAEHGLADQISFQFVTTLVEREPWQVPMVPYQLRRYHENRIAPLAFLRSVENAYGWRAGAWNCTRNTYEVARRLFLELKPLSYSFTR